VVRHEEWRRRQCPLLDVNLALHVPAPRAFGVTLVLSQGVPHGRIDLPAHVALALLRFEAFAAALRLGKTRD
jgi:hypothetical protein